jgi:hypothetical protein
MADDKPKVSEETPETGLPQPKFSEQPASPTSAASPELISAISQALVPTIEEVIERKFKSTTDKRFSKLEKGDSVLKEVLATLKSQNVAIPPEVERDFQIREYIDERLKTVVPEQGKSIPEAGTSQAQTNFDIVSELKSFDLDANDPAVLKIVSTQHRNPDHLRADLATFALGQSKQTPSETLSAAPTGGAKTSKLTDEDIEAKSAKLNELYKTPTVSAAEIKKLEAELGM